MICHSLLRSSVLPFCCSFLYVAKKGPEDSFCDAVETPSNSVSLNFKRIHRVESHRLFYINKKVVLMGGKASH